MAHDLINLNAEDGKDIVTDSSSAGLRIQQSGTGAGYGVIKSSSGSGIDVEHSGTGDGIVISHTGSAGESGIKSSADIAGEFIGLDTSEAYNTVEIKTANISYASQSVVKIVASAASQAFFEFVGAGLVSSASIAGVAFSAGIRVRAVTPQGLQMGWIPIISDTGL